MPIRPYVTYAHTVHYITVENSLLLALTTGKKDVIYKQVARWLFRESVQDSMEHLQRDTDLLNNWTINRLCTQLNVTCTLEHVAKDVPLVAIAGDERITSWARCTLALPLLRYYETMHDYDAFTREKMFAFIAAGDKSLGISPYLDDLSFAKRTTERIILKRRPLEELVGADLHPTHMARYIRTTLEEDWLLETFSDAFSNIFYHPFRHATTDVASIRAHSIYCACVYIIQVLSEMQEHVAHVYKLAFVDLFYAASGGMSDQTLRTRFRDSDQSLLFRWFPYDTRGFIGDDLPNYMHLLWQAPLRGEVDVDQFPLMKFLIKCMPFACQRRSLMDLVEDMSKDVAFWRFLSKCIWCLLAAAYPNDNGQAVNMYMLLRAKQLCDNRTLLMQALARTDVMERVNNDAQLSSAQKKTMLEKIQKERESNCLVIVIAVRKYIIHMTSYNEHYAQAAAITIDWPTFVQETNDMAQQIRTSNLFTQDVFQETRVLFARTNKAKERSVYRFRKFSCARSICVELTKVVTKDFETKAIPNFKRDINIMVDLLQKDLLPDVIKLKAKPYKSFGQRLQTSDNVHKTLKTLLAYWQNTVAYMEYMPSAAVKERILNLVHNMPRKMRLSMEGLSTLRHVANVRAKSIAVAYLLTQLYHQNVLLKTTRSYMGELFPKDVRVLAWYFHVVAQLEQVSFAPVALNHVQETDVAMSTVRHPLFPGQELNPSTFHVLYKMCCGEVATQCGRRKYGHQNVAYDLYSHQLQCNTKLTANEEDDGDNNGFISCRNQPVLCLPIRHCMLVIKSKNNAASVTRYARCRRCACLHIFDAMRGQVCEDCAKDDLTRHESGAWTRVYQCAYCHVGGAFGHCAGQTSRPRVRHEDVLLVLNPIEPLMDPQEEFQMLRFCHRCYKLAKHDATRFVKARLFEKIRLKALEQTKNVSKGIYK